MSNDSAKLADHLTRRRTTKAAEKAAISTAPAVSIPAALMDWLQDPSDDWGLAIRLLEAVQDSVNS
jgi:hypothetical protein